MEDIRRPTIRQRSNGALNLSNVTGSGPAWGPRRGRGENRGKDS